MGLEHIASDVRSVGTQRSCSTSTWKKCQLVSVPARVAAVAWGRSSWAAWRMGPHASARTTPSPHAPAPRARIAPLRCARTGRAPLPKKN